MRWLDCCWTTWTIHTRGRPICGTVEKCVCFNLLCSDCCPMRLWLHVFRSQDVQGALYSLTWSWRLTQCCALKNCLLSCHSVSLWNMLRSAGQWSVASFSGRSEDVSFDKSHGEASRPHGRCRKRGGNISPTSHASSDSEDGRPGTLKVEL